MAGRPPSAPGSRAGRDSARRGVVADAAGRSLASPALSLDASRSGRPPLGDAGAGAARTAPARRPQSASSRTPARRPQSALAERPRFSIGDRGSFGWAEIPVFPGSRSMFNTKRAQEPDADDEQLVFTYRAALGGFGVKPEKLPSEEAEAAGAPDEPSRGDAASDAGSVFSEEEGRRRERAFLDARFTAQLPGYEEDGAGIPREKAHLRRVLTSADGLYPVRNSFKNLGIDNLNYFMYYDDDPSKIMATIAADIHTGLWSCCRKTEPHAAGCTAGTHSTTKFLCTRCGVLYDTSTRKVGARGQGAAQGRLCTAADALRFRSQSRWARAAHVLGRVRRTCRRVATRESSKTPQHADCQCRVTCHAFCVSVVVRRTTKLTRDFWRPPPLG
jgi:hypothetical protein